MMKYCKYRKDKKHWVTVVHDELRIIPDALWEQAQTNRLKNVRTDFGHGPKRAGYLLTGLVVCGVCGKAVGGHWQENSDGSNRYHYYRCRRAMDGKGACANRAKVRGLEIEAAVIQSIERHLLSPDVAERISDEIVRLAEAASQTDIESAQHLQDRLRHLTEEINRLTDLAALVPDVAEVAEKIDAKQRERAALTKRLSRMARPASNLDRGQLIEEVRGRLGHTIEMVKRTDSDAELRNLLKRIIETIRLDSDGRAFLRWHPAFLNEVAGLPAVSEIEGEGYLLLNSGHSPNPLMEWKLILPESA